MNRSLSIYSENQTFGVILTLNLTEQVVVKLVLQFTEKFY